MAAKSAPLFFVATLVYSTVLAASSANASCSDRDRPGAPDAIMGEARSPTTVRVSFRTTAPTYDISAREGSPGGRIISNQTGVSPESVRSAPGRSHFDFVGLNPGSKYFFQVQARNGQGSAGCVSKQPANLYVDTPPDTHVSQACLTYARAAVDAANTARNVYRCDSGIISGPRWDANPDGHQKWCMGVPSAARQTETSARAATLEQCKTKSLGAERLVKPRRS